MITSEEIAQKAKEFEITPQNVERDYLFGWLLSGIYSDQLLKDQLILKGGNALRKAYLPNTRFSKDLDFSTVNIINPDRLHEQIISTLKYVHDRTGVEFYLDKTIVEPKLVIDNKQVYEAKVLFKGFFEKESAKLRIHMDVTEFDKIILPTQKRELIHPYSDAQDCSTVLHTHKIEEVLASKLVALLHRRKAADIFDLAFAIIRNDDLILNKGELIKTFLKKTIYSSQPQVARRQLDELALEETRPFWNHIVAPASILFGFDEAVANFNEVVTLLFGLITTPSVVPTRYVLPGSASYFRETYPSSISYYPSNLRNVIISAGENLKVLKLLYKDAWRFVEPYALKYEIRKKDGQGVEYFWAYDTSGGNSGRIGIKRFFSSEIQDLEQTDTSYSPRWPVEL